MTKLMRVNVDPTIGSNGAWAEGVKRANHILELVLDGPAARASAEWTLSQDDRGRPLLALTLSDHTGSVEARFAPDELDNAEHMWDRLHRLWGDLLQVRSHKLLEEVLKSGVE